MKLIKFLKGSKEVSNIDLVVAGLSMAVMYGVVIVMGDKLTDSTVAGIIKDKKIEELEQEITDIKEDLLSPKYGEEDIID